MTDSKANTLYVPEEAPAVLEYTTIGRLNRLCIAHNKLVKDFNSLAQDVNGMIMKITDSVAAMIKRSQEQEKRRDNFEEMCTQKLTKLDHAFKETLQNHVERESEKRKHLEERIAALEKTVAEFDKWELEWKKRD